MNDAISETKFTQSRRSWIFFSCTSLARPLVTPSRTLAFFWNKFACTGQLLPRSNVDTSTHFVRLTNRWFTKYIEISGRVENSDVLIYNSWVNTTWSIRFNFLHVSLSTGFQRGFFKRVFCDMKRDSKLFLEVPSYPVDLPREVWILILGHIPPAPPHSVMFFSTVSRT